MIQAVSTVFRFTVLLWVAHILNLAFYGGELEQCGIKPRELSGLIGVAFCPFIHADFTHLASNSLSILSIGLLAYRSETQFWLLTFYVGLLGGIGTWILGSPHTVVVGASGIIYGYLGYLLAIGIFERSASAVVLSFFTFILFSGAIYGLFPSDPHISWEGHLAGFIAGIICARPNFLQGQTSETNVANLG